MSIKMNDSFYVQGQKPVEDKRLKNGVPYTSIADANSSIPKKDRYITLEVAIRIDGVTFIYWWKDGLEDFNLVLKRDVTFATQPEMESQTPPDTENNKSVSLFGLWKWVKKLNYLYLNITTANSVLNKIWYDGLNAWVTNKDGINKQLAYDGDLVRRINGTFNPPTQAQLTSLGIKRGDFYKCSVNNQISIYNGERLDNWYCTAAQWNALTLDQKNAVKNFNIIE